jgi:2-iminobutanoate/2-iminopropanoate deaminase
MESVPVGAGMGLEVAFCGALSLDVTSIKKLIWVSGQIARGEDGQIVGAGDIRLQTEQCLENIQRNLESLGGTLDDVVQVIVFVKDMNALREIHEVRRRYFKPPYPTSTLIAVSGFVLPEALIEITAVAATRNH